MTMIPAIRRVLLALTDKGYAGTSIESVRHACRAFSAELHVLRVVPSFVPRHPFFAAIKLRDPGSILRRTGEAHSRTCKWVVATLGDSVLRYNVRTQSGELVELLSKRAAELDCQLIVLSPSLVDIGGVATSLARSANVPVLVVRRHIEDGAVFAATDLQDPDFRVLKCGSWLAQEFRAKLVTFHNFDPLPVVSATAFGVVPSLAVESAGSSTQRGNSLADASRQLSMPATPVLRSSIDPAQSIVAEAKVRDADVVVVGVHYRPWWERVLMGSVASRVTARADRSVMILPSRTHQPARLEGWVRNERPRNFRGRMGPKGAGTVGTRVLRRADSRNEPAPALVSRLESTKRSGWSSKWSRADLLEGAWHLSHATDGQVPR